MSERSDICITAVDTLPGYALAYRFLKGRKELNNPEICLLCRNEEGLEELEKMGGKIYKVDYMRYEKMRDMFKHCECVLYIPEDVPMRLSEGENIIKSAKDAGVEHFAMISDIGVDAIKDEPEDQWPNIHQYRKLEEMATEQFESERVCIMRQSMYSQFFYLMTPYVESQNALRMPIDSDKRWGCIDLRDMTDAIFMLAAKRFGAENSSGSRRIMNLYRWTPLKTMNGQEIAKAMAESLGKPELAYEEISAEDMRSYLEQIRQDSRFQDRPRKEHRGTDKPYTFPLGKYFHDEEITMILEAFELANRGMADITTYDLRNALQREPQDLGQFFMSNKEQFRRLR